MHIKLNHNLKSPLRDIRTEGSVRDLSLFTLGKRYVYSMKQWNLFFLLLTVISHRAWASGDCPLSRIKILEINLNRDKHYTVIFYPDNSM